MSVSEQILQSWEANAGNWITTIDNAELESRVLVTNNAIVNTVCSYDFNSILDIGCGEGWLTRALRKKGKQSFGVDAIAALIENAVEKEGNFYETISYKELAAGRKLQLAPFDAAVINFALIDKDDSENLLKELHRYVVKEGFVFIQTLHTDAVAENDKSGWRAGSWNGLKRDFTKPYDWYFRTLKDWLVLFAATGIKVVAIKEPLHPETQQPLSFIFVLQIINPM